MASSAFSIVLCVLAACLSAAKSQLFLQLSGPESLPSIPLPLNNQDRALHLCTKDHPITIRCDETRAGSTRATFFVNGDRFHMEFFKEYYIGRNANGFSSPWIHPDGPVKVECRLNNKERFTTYLLFKCDSPTDKSPESSIVPTVDNTYTPVPTATNQPREGTIQPTTTSSPSATPTTSVSPSPSPTTSSTRTPSVTTKPVSAPSSTPAPTVLDNGPRRSQSPSPSATRTTLPSASPSPTSSTSVTSSVRPSSSVHPSSSPSATSSTSPTPSESPSFTVSTNPSPYPRRPNEASAETLGTNSPSSTPVSVPESPNPVRQPCVIIDATQTFSGEYGQGWELDTEGGLVYNKKDRSSTIAQPGKSVLEYHFVVPEVGHYAFVLDSRSRQWTEFNDVYVRMRPGGFRFMKNGVINRDMPANEWHKVFQNDYGRSFSTKSVDYNAHSLSTAATLVPGRSYSVQLSGRSNRFTVHRIILFPCEGSQCQQTSSYWAQSIQRCTN